MSGKLPRKVIRKNHGLVDKLVERLAEKFRESAEKGKEKNEGVKSRRNTSRIEK